MRTAHQRRGFLAGEPKKVAKLQGRTVVGLKLLQQITDLDGDEVVANVLQLAG